MRVPVLLALLLLATPHASGARAFTGAYTGQPVGLDCDFEVPLDECPDAPGSHVQFGPFAPPGRVDVAVRDASGLDVGAELVFHDASGAELGRAGVCAEARKLPVPAGTAYVRVLVDTPITPPHCPAGFSLGTAGTVTLRLR